MAVKKYVATPKPKKYIGTVKPKQPLLTPPQRKKAC